MVFQTYWKVFAPNTLTTFTRARRVTGLNHVALHIAMEKAIIVVIAGAQGNEVLERRSSEQRILLLGQHSLRTPVGIDRRRARF